MYAKHGAFYYVLKGKWLALGRDLSAALVRANEIASGQLGEITEKDYLELYWRAMRAAAVRGITWDLTLDDWHRLVASANGRCAISGMRFLSSKPVQGRRRPWMPSLDRIDSAGGYSCGNVRLVCVAANIGRSDFGDAVFSALAKRVRILDKASNKPHSS